MGSRLDIDLIFLIQIQEGLTKGSAKDSQDFDFLDPDPQKYAYPRIRIQGAKYQAKTAKKKITLETQI